MLAYLVRHWQLLRRSLEIRTWRNLLVEDWFPGEMEGIAVVLSLASCAEY